MKAKLTSTSTPSQGQEVPGIRPADEAQAKQETLSMSVEQIIEALTGCALALEPQIGVKNGVKALGKIQGAIELLTPAE